MVSPLTIYERSLSDVPGRGGMKESGIGRENGIEAFEACKHCLHSIRGSLIDTNYVQILKASRPLSTSRLLRRP